jgi:hypothetical protein
MIAWAAYAGVNVSTGLAPSNSLRALPDGLETAWAIMMFVGAAAIVASLWKRRDAAISGCMYLFATTQAAFAVAILGRMAPGRRGQWLPGHYRPGLLREGMVAEDGRGPRQPAARPIPKTRGPLTWPHLLPIRG